LQETKTMNIRTSFATAALALSALAGAAQANDLQAGANVFTKNCLGCHAATPGNIGTMVLAKRLGKEQAVLDQRTNLEPAFVSAIVRYGVGIMPGFRVTEISDAELDQLTAYLARKR
jgi:mono/diheme cytochrome c family protein